MIYISLLRGINVSGQKKIKMVDLKEFYESLGFLNVQTYIQSGNVIFESKEKNQQKLEEKIENAIWDKFGFDVPVLIRSSEEFGSLLNTNPLLDGVRDIKKIYIVFLRSVPSDSVTEDFLLNYDNDEELVIKGREIFVYYIDGAGRSKTTNNFFENRLQIDATTRNLNTVTKINEMMDKSL